MQGFERESAVDWLAAAQRVAWDVPPAAALADDRARIGSWFPGGQLNTCFNALDRHVAAGRGTRDALVHVSAYTGVTRRYTYEALLARVARAAGALRARGVGPGDRVILYLPMIPEAIVAMLACARLGAIHSVVFGGFAPAELAKRITDADPTLIITASVGFEPGRRVPYLPMVREALVRSGKPRPVLVVQRAEAEADLGFGEEDWQNAVEQAGAAAPVSVDSAHPLYILYTSGTTGQPKGIVRDHGGHAVALLHSLDVVYGATPSDVYWAASDIGWVVGHSYIVYGPLLLGATTVMYEGKPVGTPDASAYWRIANDVGVDILFTAPTALRAIRREDPDGEGWRAHRPQRLRAVYLAGERADPPTVDWAERVLGLPVVDHWWQTELGWPALAASRSGVRPRGSAGRAVPGFRPRVVAPGGATAAVGTTGDLVLDLPLPPGCLLGIWNRPEGYAETYLRQIPDAYCTGDAAYVDADGHFFVMGRTDDVINVAGHRLSTSQMEQAVGAHPAVAECVVVGMPDTLKGEVPVALVVLRSSAAIDRDLAGAIVECVREEIGPVATPRHVVVVERLPKTRSGKLLRTTVRAMLAGGAWTVPATIEDPAVLDSVWQGLRPLVNGEEK
jgi:propionyl-CoA synthetase